MKTLSDIGVTPLHNSNVNVGGMCIAGIDDLDAEKMG